MTGKRYTDEFKAEAIKQVVERGYKAMEVAARLGISRYTLYEWIGGVKKYKVAAADADLRAENARLKAELRRVQEERDIINKPGGVLCQGVRVRYAFIRDHRSGFRVATMCRVLRVQRSGFYAWLKEPESKREGVNRRVLTQAP